MTDLYKDEKGNNFGIKLDVDQEYSKKMLATLKGDGRLALVTAEPMYAPKINPGFIAKVQQIALNNQRVYREVSVVYGVKQTVKYQAQLWTAIADSTPKQLAEVVKIINNCRKYTAYQFHQDMPIFQDTYVLVDRLPKEDGDTLKVIVGLLYDRFYHVYRMDENWKFLDILETISNNTIKQLGRAGVNRYMRSQYHAVPFMMK